jgi:autoinducer 2-degrading protein
MIAMWIKVRIKPDKRQQFLDVIEHDALHSEGDEPGCVRFNVLHDAEDENVYYFYEVYKDAAAQAAHQAAPHYDVWAKARDEVLDGPAERIRTETVFPRDGAYWTRNK